MVYIIVLNWNGFADTKACLASLLSLEETDVKIVVCDNASTDNSYQNLKQWVEGIPQFCQPNVMCLDASQAQTLTLERADTPALYLIQTGENKGFAGGNNVGIQFALNQVDVEYLWLLNNDTEVCADSLTELLRRVRARPAIGMCGSRLVYHADRDRIQALGGKVQPLLGTTRHVGGGWPANQVCDDEELSAQIDYPVGASMFVSAELFRKVGLLCEDYFLYYEEVDLALRAKPYFEVAVASKSIVFHKEGGSIHEGNSDFTDAHFLRSRLLFTKKHFSQYAFLVRLSYGLVALNRFRRGRTAQAVAALKMMFKGIV